MKKDVKKDVKKVVNERYIEVTSWVDNDDGSAKLSVAMDNESYNIFLREGIRASIPEDLKNKVMVLPPDFYGKTNDIKQIELPSEEIDAFVEIGIINALKEGIEKAKAKE